MSINIEKAFTFDNGLEFGEGGPKQFADAGSPIGVYNPPIGSIYIDTVSPNIIYKKIGISSSDWIPLRGSETSRFIYMEDDFISADPSGILGWVTTTVGGGSNVDKSTTGINSTNHAYGCNSIMSGNDTNRMATSTLDINGATFGYTINIQRWRGVLPVLSTSVQRYECTIGYIDNLTNTQNHTDGVYFLYDDSVSANWQCVTASGGTRTTTNSAVPVVAGSWFNLKTKIVNGSSVEFYINDNLVATNSTNIPTSGFCGPGAKMLCRVGKNFKELVLDYYSESILWPSAR